MEADFIEQSRAKVPGAKAKQPKPMPAYEALASIGDNRIKDMTYGYLVKAVGSTDIAPLRLISLADRVGVLKNTMTVFQDIIEGNPIQRITDFQVRIRERKVATGGVELFNLNGANPAQNQSVYSARTNTAGAYGNTLNIRMVASELAGQSPVEPTDLRAEQVDDELAVMRRFSNEKLLYQTENTDETVGPPAWGGFINRSTANTVSAAGGNLTNALIQGRVDAIANASSNRGMGYQLPLVCLTNATQMTVVRDLMIARYAGENSAAYFQTLAMLRAQMANVKIPADMWTAYLPMPGRPVLFICEPQLPSAQALFFDPEQPQVAKFQMMGQLGPWVVERPTEQLTQLLVTFDFQSLVDPLVESRAIVSNVA